MNLLYVPNLMMICIIVMSMNVARKKMAKYISQAGQMMTKDFEGWRDRPYLDTQGNQTIGYGFNLNDPIVTKMMPSDVVMGHKPLEKALADEIFNKRYGIAVNDASSYVGQDLFNTLSEGQKNVLVDMAYNMGLPKLQGFGGMKKALLARDFARAAEEMKYRNADKKTDLTPYFSQTGRRAKNNYLQIQEQ